MGYETENTLASVQKALDLKVDAIEIDVFKIKSEEIVVFHDKKIDRLSNDKGTIESLNIDQINTLILKGNHKIPTLEEVLDLINGKCKLNIELKGENTAKIVNDCVLNFINTSNWKEEDFLISSFNWKELQLFRELNKNIAIGILTEEEPLDAITIAKELKAMTIHPDFQTLTQEKVTAIKKEGFQVYTWTVNDFDAINKMKAFGVDGIITNYPDRV